MIKEAKNVCHAILLLLYRIMVIDHEDRPDEIELIFGDDEIKITANIRLTYESTRNDTDDKKE